MRRGSGCVGGSCSEDLAAPYEPWIAVCSQIVERAPEDVLVTNVERFGGEIGRLARNLTQRVADAPAPAVSDPETERLLFHAVAELLRAVAESVPVCVVLDDFHWADGQSVALLKHVARSVEQGAFQILVTYRDSDLGKDHPLTAVLADLRRLEGVERIGLSGLGIDDVRAMTAAAAGHHLDEDGIALAGEIAAETDGNPFFVSEILRNLSESGMVVFDETSGRWRVDHSSAVGLPDSVREVVERRIATLGERARELLTTAAVIGRSFDLHLLAKLVEFGEGELLDALEAAVAASLLSESTELVGMFSFEHALISPTLYEGLGATRRARIHLRVAEAIEEMYGPDSEEQLAELALHWRLATVSVNREKAARYSLRAGQRALNSLAPAEAARLFTDALELTGESTSQVRCEALIGLGEAQRLTGAPKYRQTLLEASWIASELQDGECAARAALANNRGETNTFGQVDQERVAAIERALELDDDPDRRARLLALHAVELLAEHDHSHRRARAEQAPTLARQAPDPRTLARVLRDWFLVFFVPEDFQQRLARFDELRASVEAAGDPALEFWAARSEQDLHAEADELKLACKTSQRMAAMVERQGDPTIRWAAAYHDGGLALLRGDLVAA